MSLTSCNSNWLLVSMILMNSLRSVSFSVAVSRLENPTMAFKGVRISWLILARNADFSRSDSWAFSRARISASSCLLRSVISKGSRQAILDSRSCRAGQLLRWFPSNLLFSPFYFGDDTIFFFDMLQTCLK